ncbi:TonB-dependent receptor [Sphingomonas sp. dw_22]|uniref:TonB-dependent receptor n=1 Tax=Sphingomonas sp. dw_22 TaxID=2721175 RepID=UPI001BD339A7|nr:TonB-dependent receptor [Sphingomonas sp. dw_22]
MKKHELLAATAFALLFVTPAFAQDSATPAGDRDQAATQDYQSANDIVVTATRRNETVQDVPIAITAIGPELLENAGVDNVRDLEQLAPSLQSSTGQSSATGTTIYIRGITTGGDNPGFEPAVGVFIDGVFRARAGVAISDLPELERVEVLRGPQGTLFGRNTSAGALSIFTAQPKFELGGYIEAGYGNYNAYELKGAITGPISEKIALRFDGGYRKRDGFLKDANSDRAINDIDRFNLRGQALFDSGDLTFRLIGDYYETDEQCCGAVSVVRGPLAAAMQTVAGLQGLTGLYTGAPSDRTMAISPARDFGEKIKDYGVSGEINYDLGAVKLTSITAYRNWRALRNQDIDFSGVDRAYRQGYRTQLKDFTQEVRFQGSAFGGKLDWLIGGFYLNETNTLRDTVHIGNDGNAYVDTVFAGLAGGQNFGSFNVPTLPQLGASLVGGPALPRGTVPLLGQLIWLQNPTIPVPGVGNLPLQAIAPPGSPLFNLMTNPLPGAVPGQGNNPDDFRVKTNAFALFTHNIINVTDKLSVTLGARWNHEKKDMTASINNNLGSCGFFDRVRAGDPTASTYAAILRAAGAFNNLFLLGCNPAVNSEFNGNYADSNTEDQITGTAKIAYKFSPKVLGYASYDRGYKSGGYNLDQATFDSVLLGGNGPQGSDLHFNKETVDAYEVGLKTEVSRQFTLNIAGFYEKFSGLQSLVFSGNNFVVQNVPHTTSKGVEVDATIQPVRELIFQLGYSYIDAKYDRDGNNFTGTPLQGQEGRQLENQPKHTITMAGTWTPPIARGINGLVHVDMRYNSEVNIPSSGPGIDGRSLLRNEGYPLISASIGIQSPDRKKSLEFWVENLTNQFYYITGFAVPEQTGNYAGYPGYPRFYGVRARFGF